MNTEMMIVTIATLLFFFLLATSTVRMVHAAEAQGRTPHRSGRNPFTVGEVVSLAENVRGYEEPEEPEEPEEDETDENGFYSFGASVVDSIYKPNVVLKEKYRIPFRIVSTMKYETLKAENQRMLVTLAKSGNQYYMAETEARAKRYAPQADQIAGLQATINGLKKENELYIILIDRYKEALKVDSEAAARLMRDNKTGRFVTDPNETKPAWTIPETEPEPEEEPEEEYLEEPEPKTSEEKYPKLCGPLPSMSKYVRAYKLKTNGATNSSVATELNIKPSSVAVYVNKGRKELEEMSIQIQTGPKEWSTLNGLEIDEFLQERKAG